MCCTRGVGESPEGGRVGDVWDLGVCDSGVGYGICLWFGKISKKWNPGFVVPPLFFCKLGLQFKGGLEFGGFPSVPDPRFAYGLP